MNWSLLLIAVLAGALLYREIGVIRKDAAGIRRERAWPQFEETYISGLQSGISIADTFSFANDFNLPELNRPISELVNELDRGVNLATALGNFRNRVQLEQADLFVEIVSLAHRTGGQNLVTALTNHAKAVRFELSARGDVRARHSAILNVAKLGLLSPWVLLAVLSTNEQTRNSFNSTLGQALLFAGFAVSFLAYRLVVAAGRIHKFNRIFKGSHA